MLKSLPLPSNLAPEPKKRRLFAINCPWLFVMHMSARRQTNTQDTARLMYYMPSVNFAVGCLWHRWRFQSTRLR